MGFNVSSQPFHISHIPPQILLFSPIAPPALFQLPHTRYPPSLLPTLTSYPLSPKPTFTTKHISTHPAMAGAGKLSWDTVEVWQKLVAAIIASGVKVSFLPLLLHRQSQLNKTHDLTHPRSTLATSPPTSAPPTIPSRTAYAPSRGRPSSSKSKSATALKTRSHPLARARPSRGPRRRLLVLLMVCDASTL